ncbi:MAG: efflux RND transporter periplasmic adaptor subunit [Desulfobacter sp.]|nr:MAG: efflux RND transporter periplasmic adaptor subunit [Desulfobacter sp.]
MKPFFVALVTCAVLACSGCSQNEPVETEKPQARPVRYTVLKSQTRTLKQTFSGTAAADREAVLSFKVAGTLKNIPVKVGDRVVSGSLLARLDETDLKVDLESARAGLKTSQADAKSAQTNVYTARSNYDRIQKLYENDNVSLSEFEQARGNYETSLAQLQAAKSRITTETSKLRAAENQLRYTRLTAPFEGIINTIAVEENEEISPGSPVLTLSGLGELDVNVDVSDLHISEIRAGMPCRVTFPALAHQAFEGRVTEVSYGASEAPTYPVTVSILSRDDRLRPGMAAEVRFDFGKAGEESGIYLPVDGVGEEQDENFVFVIVKGEGNLGTARKQKVVVGPLTGKGFLVKQGVAPGDMVATSGLQLLMDGMAVKLLDDPVNQW